MQASQQLNVLPSTATTKEQPSSLPTWVCLLLAGVVCLVFEGSLRVLFLLILFGYLYRGAGRIFCLTIGRDVRGGLGYVRLLVKVFFAGRADESVVSLFRRSVAKNPDKLALVLGNNKWTFKKLEQVSNFVGNRIAFEFDRGSCVGVLFDNSPEFVAVWLGIVKGGGVPALLNSSLRPLQLKHALKAAGAQALVFHKNLKNLAVESGFGCLWSVGGFVEGAEELKLEETSKGPEVSIGWTDRLLFIFTSGTTGMPKAAVIKHSRFVYFVWGVCEMSGIGGDDVVYDPLPLYHTAGGNLGVGLALLKGATVVLRKNFSASNFFKDCKQSNATVAQYIGEMCRYLLAQPEGEQDQSHNVRVMLGNGLRPQLWNSFTSRFKVQIAEFYGATEGNCNLINVDGRVGAVGFVSRILPWVYPVTLMAVDDEGRPLRGPNGLVLKCKPGEPGELVGRISKNPTREFSGYSDEAASRAKEVENVFKMGDVGFRTGDLLIMDDLGYFYFVDRTGDTFRWKGENVSTTEVEATVSLLTGLSDCVVFGVQVPGNEGRAGMAAIMGDVDEKDLASKLPGALPLFARPLFLRKIKSIESTGTFKLKKGELQKEAWRGEDVFLLLDDSYVPLTPKLRKELEAKKIRL